MSPLLGFFTLVCTQSIDPYLLPIGSSGTVDVKPTSMTRTATGDPVGIAEVAKAARGLQFAYLGESHDNPEHHQMQADIIKALVADGRNVIVGFEMFTRPVQDALNPWTMGMWDEERFIVESDWKKQWGFDFALYRPIFEAVRANKLPMVALNVPRDWVRTASRQGFAGLPAEAKTQLPELFMANREHRQVFDALMQGHGGTGADSIYTGQVLWDEGMADTALKYLDKRSKNPNTIFVVIAGSGHVMYSQGINYRIERRTGNKGITVVMIESDGPRKVSRGLGDFVFVTKAK